MLHFTTAIRIKKILFFLLPCAFVKANIPVLEWAKSFGGKCIVNPLFIVKENYKKVFVRGFLKSPSVSLGSISLTEKDFPNSKMFVVKYEFYCFLIHFNYINHQVLIHKG